jgi:hypothetical protein
MNDKFNIAMNDKVIILDTFQNENDIDIGVKMKRRALKSYGVQDFLHNIELISNDPSEVDLKYLWTWFDREFNPSSFYPNILIILKLF